MKQRIISFITAFLLVITVCSAQIIPNGNFENWSVKNLYDEPAPYSTSNAQAYFMGVTSPVSKTINRVSGNFALKLETVAGADTIQGLLILGTPGNQSISGGYPFVGRPDSLALFARYDEHTGDTGAFVVFFKKSGMTIGIASLRFTGTALTYTRYAVPVIWFGPPANADTLAVVAASSNLDGKRYPGNTLYLDSIILFNTLGTQFPFPNGNFENWISHSFEEPDNWNSLNVMSRSKPMVSKSTDKYTGTYALRIENVETLFGGIAGFVTNGRFDFQDKPKGGIPLNPKNNGVQGFYKYLPNGPDTAIAGIFVYHYDSAKKSSVLVMDTIFKLPPSNAYTNFFIPIDYIGDPGTDTLNISFAASNMDDTAAFIGLGSALWIDQIGLTIRDAIKPISRNSGVTVFPNPFHDRVTIVLDPHWNFCEGISLYGYDGMGRLVLKEELTSRKTEILRGNLPPGIYQYRILNNARDREATGRMLID